MVKHLEPPGKDASLRVDGPSLNRSQKEPTQPHSHAREVRKLPDFQEG